MRKAECLITVYEQLEKSVSLNSKEAARNMSAIAARYYLASVEGILMNVSQADAPLKFNMPALCIIRHLLSFLYKLMDDLKGYELPSMDALTVPHPTGLVLTEIYTPLFRVAYLLRQPDLINTLLKTLQVCHEQAFSRLAVPKAEAPPAPPPPPVSCTDSTPSVRANVSSPPPPPYVDSFISTFLFILISS